MDNKKLIHSCRTMRLDREEGLLSTSVYHRGALQSIVPRTVSLLFFVVRFFELSFLDPLIEKRRDPEGSQDVTREIP